MLRRNAGIDTFREAAPSICDPTVERVGAVIHRSKVGARPTPEP
jgi:hypothetical protein